jgi:four helix bundle protein
MEKNNSKFKIEFKKRCYVWVIKLIRILDTLPKDQTSSVISKQLLRSGTSIAANYIEAQSASSRKDFTNFLTHALKSANESKFWLALLRDAGKCDEKTVSNVLDELTEISNILASIILKMKGKK